MIWDTLQSIHRPQEVRFQLGAGVGIFVSPQFVSSMFSVVDEKVLTVVCAYELNNST